MSTNLSRPLDDGELEQLDAWLMSDDSPEECMDISMLDGFLAAIVSGPVVMPSEWLPAVWGPGEWRGFRSEQEAKRILTLIMRLQNDVALSLHDDPSKFEPIFYENRAVDPPVEIADEWCYGYMRGVKLRQRDWRWLLKDRTHKERFAPILAMAYFTGKYKKGYERVHTDRELFERTKSLIPSSVAAIYQLWREQLYSAGHADS